MGKKVRGVSERDHGGPKNNDAIQLMTTYTNCTGGIFSYGGRGKALRTNKHESARLGQKPNKQEWEKRGGQSRDNVSGGKRETTTKEGAKVHNTVFLTGLGHNVRKRTSEYGHKKGTCLKRTRGLKGQKGGGHSHEKKEQKRGGDEK